MEKQGNICKHRQCRWAVTNHQLILSFWYFSNFIFNFTENAKNFQNSHNLGNPLILRFSNSAFENFQCLHPRAAILWYRLSSRILLLLPSPLKSSFGTAASITCISLACNFLACTIHLVFLNPSSTDLLKKF